LVASKFERVKSLIRSISSSVSRFLGAVIELGGAGAFMRRHRLGVLKSSAISKYAVIPVAQKVLQPIGALISAAFARRRSMRQPVGLFSSATGEHAGLPALRGTK
jgi:hypothetical protein